MRPRTRFVPILRGRAPPKPLGPEPLREQTAPRRGGRWPGSNLAEAAAFRGGARLDVEPRRR